MSEILCRWLNNDVRLSKKTDPGSLERDMASGWLFGEVLHRHGLQNDFPSFSKGDTSAAKLNNYKRLAPTLRLLGVPFDANIAMDVMNAKSGVANRVAYQLFVALNDKGKAELARSQATLDSRKARSNMLNDKQFEDRLTRNTQRQAHIEFAEREAQIKQRQREKEEVMLKKEQAEAKRLEKMRAVKIKEALNRTMEIKKKEEERRAELEATMLAKLKNTFRGSPMQATQRKMSGGRNSGDGSQLATRRLSAELQNLGERPMSRERLPPLDFSIHPESDGRFNLGDTTGRQVKEDDDILNNIRQRKAEVEFARSERDKRRRHTMQKELEALKEANNERHKEFQTANIHKKSTAELQIAEKLETIRAEEEVIIKNRAMRQQQYEERRRKEFEQALNREAQIAQKIKMQNLKAIEERNREISIRREKRKEQNQIDTKTAISQVLQELVELSLKCAERREVTGGEVSGTVYHEWKQTMLLPKGDPPAVQGTLVESEEAGSYLDDTSYDDYLFLRNNWAQYLGTNKSDTSVEDEAKPDTEEIEDKPTDSNSEQESDDSVPVVMGPNRVLAHALDRIAKVVDPPAERPPKPTFASTRLRVAVVGKPFSGKTSSLKRFMDTTGTTVIDPTILVTRALQDYQKSIASNDNETKQSVKSSEEEIQETVSAGLATNTTNQSEDEAKESLANVDVEETKSEELQEKESKPLEEIKENDDSYIEVSDGTDVQSSAEINQTQSEDAHPPNIDTPINTDEETSVEKEKLQPLSTNEPASEQVEDSSESNQLSAVAEIGKKISTHVTKGESVPDALLCDLIALAIKESDPEKGWIIDGFPATLSQAKELEKVLTGRDDDWEKNNPRWTSELEPLIDEEKPVRPPSPAAGLDAVVHMDIDNDTVVRRALGRRIDKETNTVYHLEGLGFPEPPQVIVPEDDTTEVAPEMQEIIGLHERLAPLDDKYNTEMHILKRLASWEVDTEEYLEWYRSKFDNVRSLTASSDRDSVAASLHAELEDIGREEERDVEEALRVQLAKEEQARRLEEEVLNELEGQQIIETSIAEELASDEAEAQRLAEAARLAEEEEAAKSAGKKKKKPPKKGKGKGAEEEVPDGADLEALIKKEQEIRQESALARQKPSFEYAADKAEIGLDVAQWLHRGWNYLEKHYALGIKHSLHEIRRLRHDVLAYVHQNRLDFAKFLVRPDSKQEYVVNWQLAYNEIPFDMRDDPDTKAELHLRAIELQDTLWDICTERENEAQEEITSIQTDGYIESTISGALNQVSGIMQMEVSRYKEATSMLREYYQALKGEIIPETPDDAQCLPYIPFEAPVSIHMADEKDGSAQESQTEENTVEVPQDIAAEENAESNTQDTQDQLENNPNGSATLSVDDSEKTPASEKKDVVLTRAFPGATKEEHLEILQENVDKLLSNIPTRENPQVLRDQKAAEEAELAAKAEKAKGKKKKGEPEVVPLETPSAEELLSLEAEKEIKELHEKMDDEVYMALINEDNRFKARVEIIRKSALDLIEYFWTQLEMLWEHLKKTSKVRSSQESSSVKELISDVRNVCTLFT